MTSEYTHFGTQISLFSGKTRTYLNYKKIPFKEVLPSAAIINKELYPATGVKVIPVVKTPDGEYLQDTTQRVCCSLLCIFAAVCVQFRQGECLQV